MEAETTVQHVIGNLPGCANILAVSSYCLAADNPFKVNQFIRNITLHKPEGHHAE